MTDQQQDRTPHGRTIPPYPSDGGVVEQVDWLFNYGLMTLMKVLSLLFLIAFFKVLTVLKRVFRA